MLLTLALLPMLSTPDLGVINAVVKDPGNVAFAVSQFRLRGFVDDFNAYYRLPSARRTGAGATIRVTVPRAGKFYPAVILYDTEGPERFVLSVDGRPLGEASANRDNHRQRLFFLPEPVTFRGGERIEVRPLDAAGIYRTESIVLLRVRPEARPFVFEFRDVRWYNGTLTWRTNWATACTLEFDGRRVTETRAVNNHRALLAGVAAGREVRYRITAAAFEGGEASTGWKTMVIPAPPSTAGSVRRGSVPLTVELPGSPVSAGVPFARGLLGSDAHLRLIDSAGRETPLQSRTLARWGDGSVKWALVDFLSQAAAYTLEYGSEATSRATTGTLQVSEDTEGVRVSTGRLDLRISKKGLGFLNGGAFYLTGPDGTVYDTLHAPDEVVVEERGPVRACVRVAGSHRARDGRRLFRYTLRLHAWAGERLLRVQHTFCNDSAASEFAAIRSLVLRIPAAGKETGSVRVRRDTERPAGVLRRGDLTLAVRDFWQNYPKDLAADSAGLELGICPRLDSGEYASARGALDEHRLFYNLRDGLYRFRQGMSKTHEFWIGFGDGKVEPRPSMVSAPPAWYAASGALGHMTVPAARSPYDAVVARAFRDFLANREKNHEFGMLNWGDWWGEREINWGNCEYDTQHTLFLHFARTGDFRYFREGERAEWHNRDVDTVHAHADPLQVGGVWDHKVGHTGDWFPGNPVAQLAESGDMTPSHTFIEGHLDYYFLTGDARSLETARATADRYAGWFTRNFEMISCRQAGWPLILAVAAHRATGDPYYRNLAGIIFERVLELQTPDGGWSRKLARGHCDCIPRHMGNAGFMVGVLMSGLRMYYEDTGDERAADSIVRAARFLVSDMWMPGERSFRYTSCPRTGPSGNHLSLDGLTFAYARTRDPRLLEPLRAVTGKVLGGVGGFGKSFSQTTRQMPRFVDDALVFIQR